MVLAYIIPFLQKNKTFFFGSNFFLAHIQGVRFETILREI